MHTYLDIEVPILVRQCAALAQSVKRRTLKAFETNVFVVGSRPATDIFFIFRSLALYRLQNVSQSLGVCFLQLENEI